MELYTKLREIEKFFLIAGPCLIESEELVMQTAERLVRETEKHQLLLIFKSSYKKANRTSGSSPAGPGLEQGLRILEKVKQEFGLPVLTDVHETGEVSSVGDVADVVQIPAFLSRQTDLLQAAGRTGRIVNIKKGQFMAPADMEAAAAKVAATNNKRILLTERGTSFGYGDLVVDFRSFAIMASFGYPVVYDVTHSLQKPSQQGITGGNASFAPMMAKAALATGRVSGIFLETHPDPARALSDAATQISLSALPGILDEMLSLLVQGK